MALAEITRIRLPCWRSVTPSSFHAAALAGLTFSYGSFFQAQIHHENVVSIVDMDVDSEGYVFLVMELVRGVPLSELRDRFGDLSFAIPVLRQIAEGASHYQERARIYRKQLGGE